MVHENINTYAEVDRLAPIDELPDPFIDRTGKRISSAEEWSEQRNYLKEMLQHYMYGTIPPAPGNTLGEILYTEQLYEGRAIYQKVRISFGPEHKIALTADIFRPAAEGRYPAVISKEDQSPLLEDIVCNRGYIFASFTASEFVPDSIECKNSPLAKEYPDYDWGCIAMWSWGFSRIMDYLETTDYADKNAFIVTGHSRSGKAALCAAIFDERAAICAPNDSGCGGLGSLRFLGSRYGLNTGHCEAITDIVSRFPYWWGKNFASFRNTDGQEYENRIPFDAHTMRALIAPRAIISTEAYGDSWSNPYGTLVAWRAAQEVFDFLGVPDNNAIHYREGGHEYQDIDWQAMIDYCDRKLRGICVKTNICYFTDRKLSENEAFYDWKEQKYHYSWQKP